MNHRHGGYFLMSYKNINKFYERFIRILLKTIIYNRMLMPRITAFGRRLEMETKVLKDLRAAC